MEHISRLSRIQSLLQCRLVVKADIKVAALDIKVVILAYKFNRAAFELIRTVCPVKICFKLALRHLAYVCVGNISIRINVAVFIRHNGKCRSGNNNDCSDSDTQIPSDMSLRTMFRTSFVRFLFAVL